MQKATHCDGVLQHLIRVDQVSQHSGRELNAVGALKLERLLDVVGQEKINKPDVQPVQGLQ